MGIETIAALTWVAKWIPFQLYIRVHSENQLLCVNMLKLAKRAIALHVTLRSHLQASTTEFDKLWAAGEFG